MQVPRFMRGVNRAFTNRLMGPLARFVPPLAVVHHRGRSSGRAYRTPVLAFPVEAGVLTPLPYGTDTDWLRNLFAAGGGTLETSGRMRSVERPRLLDAEEAAPLVPAALQPVVRHSRLPGFLRVDFAPRASSARSGPSKATS